MGAQSSWSTCVQAWPGSLMLLASLETQQEKKGQEQWGWGLVRKCPDNPELSAAARWPLPLPLTLACPGHHSGPATQDTGLKVCHLEVPAEGGILLYCPYCH